MNTIFPQRKQTCTLSDISVNFQDTTQEKMNQDSLHSNYTSICNSPQRFNSNLSNSKVTPTRFWRWFHENDFQSFLTVSSGNFGEVKKATFKDKLIFQSKTPPSLFSQNSVAIKDPKGSNHNFIQEQYELSHEVSCTVILHPSIVNYIGGVDLRNPQRVGIIMELMDTNLRLAIQGDKRLKSLDVQLSIAKHICSGMNFLHSINPNILHRDLRTPNILLNQNLDCKIADFGMSNNSVYEDFRGVTIYTSLIPPECDNNPKNFTAKGDVYFYGWILAEMFFQISDIGQLKKKLQTFFIDLKYSKYKQLMLDCINKDPNARLSFCQVLSSLNSIINCKYDLEQIAQNNLMDVLKKGISENIIVPQLRDTLNRNLFHQCCIFGNLEMLKFLVGCWGKKYLSLEDKFDTTLTHFAARNGNLAILKYLKEQNSLSNKQESRFHTTPLNLAIAMKHFNCVDFLIEHATQLVLDSALLSSCQEGNLILVKKLINCGASLNCVLEDIGSNPFDRACYHGHLEVVKYLIKKGANVNQTHKDHGSTPLFQAAQNDQKEVVEVLLQNGADPNISRADGCSPLYISAEYGYKEVVQILLKFSANPNLYKTNQSSPLIMASHCGHPEIVTLLLQHGADPNHKYLGRSGLSWAQFQGHTSVIQAYEEFQENPKKKK